MEIDSPSESKKYPLNCYFGYVCEASQIKGRESSVGHIYFAHIPGREIPANMRSLRDEIELVSASLLDMFTSPTDSKFRSYFDDLLSLAQMGLVCDQANPTAALDALGTLKAKILKREGKRIKARYLTKLLLVVLSFGAAFWLIGILANFLADTKKEIRPGHYFYMLSAAMPAIWLSYASRKLQFTYDDLIQPEDNEMGPFHRVFYVVGFTLILAVLGYLKVAGVFLGDFSTQDLGKSIPCALVFGAVCGLSEMLLATTVAPHVSRIMTGLSQPTQKIK